MATFKTGAAEFEWDGKSYKVPVDTQKNVLGQPACALNPLGKGWTADLQFRQNPGRDDYVIINLMNATGGASAATLVRLDVRSYPHSAWRMSLPDHDCFLTMTRSGADGFEGSIACKAKKGAAPPFKTLKFAASP